MSRCSQILEKTVSNRFLLSKKNSFIQTAFGRFIFLPTETRLIVENAIKLTTFYCIAKSFQTSQGETI